MLALVLALAAAFATPTKPNVLFVIADDFGDWEMDDPTINHPTIDVLSAVGIRFHAFYGSANCSPFRAWVQTGLHPWRFGLGTIVSASSVNPSAITNPPLPLYPLSLAEMARHQGYRTAHFGKDQTRNDNGDELLGSDANDSLRRDGYHTHRAGSTYGFGPAGQSYTSWTRVDDGIETVSTDYNTRAIADAFIGWIGEPEQLASPWFAWVAFNAPHVPFHVPSLAELPPGTGIPVNPTNRVMYELAIEALDFHLARVFAALPPDTWVFFAGDNGTPMNATDSNQSSSLVKGSVWNGGVSPPLVIYGPGIVPAVLDNVISCGDLWATIADIVGFGGGRPQDSISIATTVSGSPGARAIAFSLFREPNGPGPFTKVRCRASTNAGSLLVIDVDGDGPQVATQVLVHTLTDAPLVDPALQGFLLDALEAEGLLVGATL